MIKRFLFISTFLVLILFLSACSDHKYHIYIGKSDNWEVTYGRDENFAIKYVGEESMPEGEINYIIEQRSRTTDGNRSLEEGVLNIKRPFSENDESDIKVRINWETYSEEFILERQ